MLAIHRYAVSLMVAAVVMLMAMTTLRAEDFTQGRSLLLDAQPFQGTTLEPQDLMDRPVVVTFFASWCPPCTDEFRALNAVREKYGRDRLGIVAVNAFEDWGGKKNPARMARFLKKTGPRFDMVEGTAQILKIFGNVERIPTLIIYDAAGREVWRFVHEVNATKMSANEEEILEVLARLGPS